LNLNLSKVNLFNKTTITN